MRKIAVALAKGGVGKTTSAVSLAAGLALQGQRVLLVDVDTQGQAGRSLGIQTTVGIGRDGPGGGFTGREHLLCPGQPVAPGGRAVPLRFENGDQ